MNDEVIGPRDDRLRGLEREAPSACGDAFERHRAALEARIRHWLPPSVRRRVSVADVLQETRIVALRRQDEVHPQREGDYLAWLLRIAELKAREALRAHVGTAKRTVKREAPAGPGAGVPDLPSPGASPSEGAMTEERRAWVLRALATLPADHREVVQLVRIGGLPIAEVASRMDRSPGAVKALYGRALAGLARALGAADGR